MKTYSEMEYHPASEHIVKFLCGHANNEDPSFFRTQVAFYLSMVAASMRCNVVQHNQDKVPVNMYAINLAPSGAGKGKATHFLEEHVVNQFKYYFKNRTWEVAANEHFPLIANDRAIRKGTDPDTELRTVKDQFSSMGAPMLVFDSGTAPAIKQARDKLLLANSGSLSLIMDEMGANLSGNMELLQAYLELFDQGKIKGKLIKNNKENIRMEEIEGKTPCNLLLFGVPIKLLDGAKTEEDFYSLLAQGFARRSFFSYSRKHLRALDKTADIILDEQLARSQDTFIQQFSDLLGLLADPAQMHKNIGIPRDVALIFVNYQLQCERKADSLGEHEDLRKNEISHRHFKAMKLSGAYAFIDGAPEVTEEHAYAAIKLAEDSGKHFVEILTRDRPHIKLAKYIADVGRPITQSDMVGDLPYYRGNVSQKQEMLTHAVAYGYQNNIIIKKYFEDQVEFLRGETLVPTNLDKIKVSWSKDIATGYQSDCAKFEDLYKLTQTDGLHWCTHNFKGGHRSEESALNGFNLVVLDVDHGVNLSTAKMLLSEYKAMFYTTKRHTDADNRFRIILPINYELELDGRDYKEFMSNLFQWLPFEVDTATGQRSRKWLSHNGEYVYQDGALLDVLPFIPKTSKNVAFKAQALDQQGMDNLERWMMNNTGDGNRNHMLLRYAMVLVDAHFDFDSVRQRVNTLNNKMTEPLEESEIMGTIMVTVSKAIANR